MSWSSFLDDADNKTRVQTMDLNADGSTGLCKACGGGQSEVASIMW